MSGVGAARPASLSSCVKLSACSFSPVPLKNSGPVKRVAAGLRHDVHHQPAVSDSPRPPEVVNVISCAFRCRRVARRLIAARRIADIEPVDRQAALVVAAAVDRETASWPCP